MAEETQNNKGNGNAGVQLLLFIAAIAAGIYFLSYM